MSEDDDANPYVIVRKVAGKVHHILSHTKVWDFETMEALTHYGAHDDSWVQTWIERFQLARAISDHYYDRPFRPIDSLTPLEVKDWVGEMKLQFSIAVRMWANDAAHWMPLYAFLFPSDSQSFRSMNPGYYVKQLIVPGRFAIIDGDLDSGKSDHAIKLCQTMAEVWEEFERVGDDSTLATLKKEHDKERGEDDSEESVNVRRLSLIDSKGPRFIANIEVPKTSLYAKYFQFATRLSDMIILMAKNALEGHFSVLVLDEMGMTYNRKRVTSRNNFSLEGIFRLVRKFKASVIVITQNKELDLPDHLRRPDKGAKTIVEKLTRQTAIYTVHGVNQLFKQRVHGIPPTVVTFDTQAVASLAIDIDPRMLVESVELEKSHARSIGANWTTEDMFHSIIDKCEEAQKDADAAFGNVLRQKVMAMLKSINQDSGELYTPEEVQEETGASMELIEECMSANDQVAQHPGPEQGDRTELVQALLKANLPVTEVARLGAVPENFVQQVIAASPPPKKPKTPPAPVEVA